jgi:polysaccharide biosynthesis transport protein
MAFKSLPPGRGSLPVEQRDPRFLTNVDDHAAPPPYTEDGERPTPWHRYLAALARYRWLVVACLILGALGGVGGARMAAPEYESHATIWISAEGDRRQASGGPIQAQELLNPTGWDELFRSQRVTDSVVLKRRLYLSIPRLDSSLFTRFSVAATYQPGVYQLTVAPGRDQYTLSTGRERAVVERGTAGDSIGRRLGFLWRPSAAAVRQAGTAEFYVASLSQASEGLLANLTTVLPDNPSYMRVSLTGSSAASTAGTLNEWLSQFVTVAGELKRRKVAQLTSILQAQTAISQSRLNDAERALVAFERNAIAHGDQAAVTAGKASAQMLSTQSLDGGTVAGSSFSAQAGGPAANDFYALKFARDNLHDDVTRVQSVLRAPSGQLNPTDLLAIPALMVGAEDLRGAIQEFTTKQNDLHQLKLKYTDSYKPVQDLEAQVTTLQNVTIPRLAGQSLARLQGNELRLNQRIASATQAAIQLPTGQIEEMRRQRDVSQSSQIYNTLQARLEEALLAEQSAIPDVQVLDRAVLSTTPSRNSKPRVFFLALAAGLGVGLGLALLLDRLDRRVRYPEQATDELGLPIIGTVPAVRPRAANIAVDDEGAASALGERHAEVR